MDAMRSALALALITLPLAPVVQDGLAAGQRPAAATDGQQQRWLVRMELARPPVLAAFINDRRQPLRVWTTGGSAELLVEVGEDLLLVDTRQGRLFQMAAAVRDQLEREFQLLFAYPVPRVETLRERPADPVEIVDAGVEARRDLMPTETAMGRALDPQDGRLPLMPNVAVAEYREAWRVAFRLDERDVVVYLEPPAGGGRR